MFCAMNSKLDYANQNFLTFRRSICEEKSKPYTEVYGDILTSEEFLEQKLQIYLFINSYMSLFYSSFNLLPGLSLSSVSGLIF